MPSEPGKPVHRPVRTTWLRQAEPVENFDAARLALLGACLLGVLDHHRKRPGTGSVGRADATVGDLRRVFLRGDKGLHGCGFEYAVHAAVNHWQAIPDDVCRATVAELTEAVSRIYDRLGIECLGWPAGGLRSVRFGVERDNVEEVIAQLGSAALLWPARGAEPYLLAELLPHARCPAGSRRYRSVRLDQSRVPLPEDVAMLWKTDLFLGGKVVADSFGPGATAWVAASVKYPARTLRSGPGLHLGVETSWFPSTHPCAAKRAVLTTHRDQNDLHVVTLPLDGDFVHAFNSAFHALRTFCRNTSTRSKHPVDYPDYGFRWLMGYLEDHRGDRVVDVAERLLRGGQRGLVEPIAFDLDADGVSGRIRLVPVPRCAAA
jgi:hypothetical protein